MNMFSYVTVLNPNGSILTLLSFAAYTLVYEYYHIPDDMIILYLHCSFFLLASSMTTFLGSRLTGTRCQQHVLSQ